MNPTLISHALDKPLKLKDHLDQVISASRYLISLKSLSFNGISEAQIREVSILIAACHDFGKSTIFFQDYIKSKIKGSKYTGNERYKSHSLISALFGCYLVGKWLSKNKKIHERWRMFLPFAVLVAIEGHHGYYSSIEDVLRNVNEGVDSELLPHQLSNIQQEIFTYEFKGFQLRDGINFDLKAINQIQKYLRRFHREYQKESLENQAEQRILGLLLYSILLESDKAYLASDNPEQYEREPICIPDDIVDRYIQRLKESTEISKERRRAYAATMKTVEDLPLEERIHSITLPTGLGKTLLSASWAIKLRSRLSDLGIAPKIIVSLPFLSIIEQTDGIYKQMFAELYEKRVDRLYTARYSIADFEFRDGIDTEERSDNSTDFYLSVWNSEAVVTTFDQLLYSFFSLKPKHLMRFHNLFNSILIFDEIQALPSDLWRSFELFFRKLSEVGKTHIVLMSATQPGFFPGAVEMVPDHQEFFKNRKRVSLVINHESITIDKFIEGLLPKLDELFDKSVMIVLNTRPSSRMVYKTIGKEMAEGHIKERPLVYLSSYVAPAQRTKRIKKIKQYGEKRTKNPVVITTQCVEAGVDIDMDYVIRDWAPLDSIFQVCGRCNRNGEKQIANVEIVHLISENGKLYSLQVYDEILLECTAFTLNNSGALSEDKFYDYGSRYFAFIRERLGHSNNIARAFAQYSHKYEKKGKEKVVNIRELLRGDEVQEQFIVPPLAPQLPEEIRKAVQIKDRWERRYALKRLSKRINENSINIRFEKWMPNKPDDLADYRIGNFWVLDKQFYDKEGVGFSADIYKRVERQKFI